MHVQGRGTYLGFKSCVLAMIFQESKKEGKDLESFKRAYKKSISSMHQGILSKFGTSDTPQALAEGGSADTSIAQRLAALEAKVAELEAWKALNIADTKSDEASADDEVEEDSD